MNLLLPPLRPPGALEEKKFLQLCVRCGQCLTACPYHSLQLAKGFGKTRQTPIIYPQKIPCYLCMKCIPACPTGALDEKITQPKDANMGQAYIQSNLCHNFQSGIMCMTCYDRCPLRGSAVILDQGLQPAITKDCVGCGVCAYVCPVEAITIVPKNYDYLPPFAIKPKTPTS